MKYEQTTFDRLRAGARESKDPVYEDYEKRLADMETVRAALGLFLFMAFLVGIAALSLFMGPQG